MSLSRIAWLSSILIMGCSSPHGGSSGGSTNGSDVLDSGSSVDGDLGTTDGTVAAPCAGLAERAACDDGNPCTSGDLCLNALCVGGVSTVCDEHGQCQAGSCDQELGCVYEPVADDTSCSVACFSEAVCKGGDCEVLPETKIACPNPVEPCVAQWQCDSATGECTVPIYEAENTPCNSDSNVCTLESCGAVGECLDIGILETCDAQKAGNPCWTYSCNQKSGCTATAFVENNSCDDGNSCTVSDLCTYNATGQELCIGQPMNTDDQNECTDDSCKAGVPVHTSIDGLSCDPGDGCSPTGVCKNSKCIALSSCTCDQDADCGSPADLCLGTMTCDKSGALPKCKLKPGTAVICGQPNMLCYTAICNSQTGQCDDVYMGDGTICDDTDKCTKGETCGGGTCVNGIQIECDDNDDCTSNSCESDKGCVFTPIPNCGGTDGITCESPGAGQCITGACLGDTWLESILGNGSQKMLIVAKHKCYDKKRSVLRFSLESVPLDKAVLKVEMRVYYSGHHEASSCKEAGIDRVIAVHAMLREWNEVTANRLQATQGVFWNEEMVGLDDVDAASQSTDEQLWELEDVGWKSFDITSLAKTWLNDPSSNHGVLIRAVNENDNGHDMRIHSREAVDTTLRPHLRIISP